jgi:hypothetical protein
MVEPSDWTPHIDEIEYEIACETCGKRRKLGEYAYEKFTEVFAVKGGREDAPH